MFKLVIALLTALVFVGIGGVTVSAGAHDCGCQTDNSGPGSSGVDNSGPGNACHDNSGPGSTTSGSSGSSDSGSSGSNSGPSANSGPGNAEDDCPVDTPDDPGDSTDPGNGPSGSGGGGSGTQASGTGTVVLGAQASTGTTPAGAEVPSAVNAGLTGGEGEESSSLLAGLAILLGLAMTFVAVRRRHVT